MEVTSGCRVWEGVLWKTDFKRSDCAIAARKRRAGTAAPPPPPAQKSSLKTMLASFAMGGAAYKQRYFVFDERTQRLYYWKTEDDAAKDRYQNGALIDAPAFASGSLALSTIVSAGKVGSDRAVKLQPPKETMAIFELRSETRAYVFATQDLVARRNWFTAFRTAAPEVKIDRSMESAAQRTDLRTNAEVVKRAAMGILGGHGARQAEMLMAGPLAKPNFKNYSIDGARHGVGGKTGAVGGAKKLIGRTKDRNSWAVGVASAVSRRRSAYPPARAPILRRAHPPLLAPSRTLHPPLTPTTLPDAPLPRRRQRSAVVRREQGCE